MSVRENNSIHTHFSGTIFGHNPFFILAIFCVVILSVVAFPQTAHANNKYASIIVNADTGQVIHERNPDKRLHPASITKAMTLMLMFDALENGRAGLKDRIKISSHAASMVPSKIGLPVGGSIAVEDAILALVTKSANDIAAAMAEHLGGSEKNFAKMMTNKAHQIGMKNTTFKNASGLHDPGQVTTVRDMAIMTRVMIKSYPRYYKYFSTKNFTFQGKSYRNHNRLMETYPGMDGLKTGYINASGFNLAASAVRGNTRLIGVVFGGRTTHSRNAHMKELLDAGFKKSGAGAAGNDKPLLVANAGYVANAPIPKRKPVLLRAVAALNNNIGSVTTPTQMAMADTQRPATQYLNLNTQVHSGEFEGLVGEGDIDSVASRRIETGLVAISAVKGEQIPAHIAARQRQAIQPARLQIPAGQAQQLAKAQTTSPTSLSAPMRSINNNWAIQIGAFASRAQTDIALGKAVQKLPENLRVAQPLIVPTQKGDAWLFRARLNGYNEAQAMAACNYLTDCIPVRPVHAQ